MHIFFWGIHKSSLVKQDLLSTIFADYGSTNLFILSDLRAVNPRACQFSMFKYSIRKYIEDPLYTVLISGVHYSNGHEKYGAFTGWLSRIAH